MKRKEASDILSLLKLLNNKVSDEVSLCSHWKLESASLRVLKETSASLNDLVKKIEDILKKK
jgi:hypothetical protein